MPTIHYKLATWDPKNACFRQGKESFDSEAGAHTAAVKPGLYRISCVTDSGTVDLDPFEIEGRMAAESRSKKSRRGPGQQPLNTRVTRRAPGT